MGASDVAQFDNHLYKQLNPRELAYGTDSWYHVLTID